MINKSIFLKMALVLSLFSGQCFADPESWYANFGLGFVKFNHPTEVEQFISSVDALPGIDRSQFAIDLVGIYFPVAPTTAVGFAISSESDKLSDAYGNSLTLNTSMFGVSAMHFLGREIGEGVFFRGAIGSASADVVSVFGNTRTTFASDTGSGFMLGVGYGIPINAGARILLSLNFANKNINGYTYGATRTTCSIFW